MIEKSGTLLYTLSEAAEILSVGKKRLMDAMDQHTLIPTDLEKWRGKQGFRYLFAKEELERYAKRIGLQANFDEKAEHERRVMEARREVRKVVDPVEVEDGTLITADNVAQVFAQIQEENRLPTSVRGTTDEIGGNYRFTNLYVVQLGKGFISENDHGTAFLQTGIVGYCIKEKDDAVKIQEKFGGTLMQVVLKEASS